MAPGPSGADLADADEAVAYLQNAQLRSGLLAALNAVDCAMSAAGPKAPWQVLDRGFGRAADSWEPRAELLRTEALRAYESQYGPLRDDDGLKAVRLKRRRWRHPPLLKRPA